MSTSLNQTHKVNKGESLRVIAKKYGHNDWKTIWKAPENRTIVSKRSKPENIAAGDMLVIPPNQRQLKENAAKLLSLNQARDAVLKVWGGLKNDVGRLEKSIKVYDDLIKGSRETTQQVINQLERNLNSIRKLAIKVDVAKFFVDMGRTLGTLVGIGYKAIKASGEALKELNKEALHEAVHLATDPLEKVTVKAVSTLKDRDRKPLAFLGILADSYEKMTSPSFWAYTIVQKAEGKSWSDAVTTEIGDDIEERIKWVVAQGAKNINQLQADQNAQRARLAEKQPLIRECEARLKWHEQQARELPGK
jgi:hypothetical protein